MTPRNDASVALLRGINVGGKNKLPMAALVELFEAAGCRDVRTLIQSGNVVFRAPARLRARLGPVVQAEIERRHGLRVPVLLREARALEEVLERNPFLGPRADTGILHVVFLAEAPTARALAALDPRRSPPDEFVVDGSEIFLRCPNGLARTKLTNAWFDAALATTSTVRNWRTVVRLAEMARA